MKLTTASTNTFKSLVSDGLAAGGVFDISAVAVAIAAEKGAYTLVTYH